MADEPLIADEPRVDRPSRGPFGLACVALLIVTTLAYSPTFHAGLLGWDDYSNFAKNPLLNPPSLDGLSWFWRHSHMHLYVPITYTIWSALAGISHAVRPGGEMWPLPFHVANLAAHLATIVLLIAMLRRIGLCRVPTLLAATLFALHPLNVEAVAWASGLKDVFSTTLMFAAALAWVGPRENASPRRWVTFATALYVLALLTKPTAIVTPILAWLLGLAVGRSSREARRGLAPWMILAVPIAFIGRAVQPPTSGEVVSLTLRPLVALDAIGFYLAKLAWPVGLAADHGRTPTRLLAWTLSQRHLPIAIAVLVGITISIATASRPQRRLIVIGLAIALVTLAPVLGIVPFDFQAISSVADHYCYPAMIGIALAAGVVASRWRVRVIHAITVLVAIAFVPMTFHQVGTWRSDASMFSQVAKVNPQSWTAASEFSFTALNDHYIDEAERWARRAIELNPRYPTAWVNLASAQSRRGDNAAAIGSLGRAYEIEPDNAVVNLNLGGLLASQGDLQTALPLLQHAADLDPTSAAAQGNLGSAFLQTGRAREALERLAVAVKLAPDDLSLRTRRVIALNANGRATEARRELAAVLAIDPAQAEAIHTLASIDAASTRPSR